MSLLSLEGPYISLFRLLRESSPSLLHPSLLFFVFSPLDPANPPTHPLSVYTAAKGGLPMLEGFSFGQAFNRAWCTFPVSNNGDFPTPPPKKKTKAVLVLISSSITVTHPSGIFSSWLGHFLIPSSCIEVPSFPPKIPFIPFPSNPLPPTQNLPSSSPSSILTQSLLPLVSLQGSYSKPPPSSSLILSLCFIFFGYFQSLLVSIFFYPVPTVDPSMCVFYL